MTTYFPGLRIRSDTTTTVAQPASFSGAVAVTYEVDGAPGEGVQVSSTEIQPNGFPAVPAITIGTGSGEATNVSIATTPTNPADFAAEFVDEDGDRMTGALNMQGNQVQNTRITQGSF